MAAKPSQLYQHDRHLVYLGNLLIEASVLYLVLAAWVRPRSGPGSLLPLAAALALPVAFTLRQLIDSSTVPVQLRQAAALLLAWGWGLLAAYLVAPGGYWEREAPRSALVFGAMIGNQPSSGLQPLAFWASVLAWWRGHQLPGWEPTLEEALGRFRLAAALVGAAIIVAAANDAPGSAGRVQGEQAALVTVFLIGALLTTASARRREMASGLPAAAPTRPSGSLSGGGLLTAGLVAGLVVGALLVGALSALVLTPRTFAPLLDAGGQALGAVGAGLAWLFGSIAAALAGLMPAPAAPSGPTPPSLPFRGLAEVFPRLNLFLPDWFGPLLFGLIFALLFAAAIWLLILSHRGLSHYLTDGITAVGGFDTEQAEPLEPRGPAVVLALLYRLLRGVRGEPRRRKQSGTAQPRPSPDRPPEASTVEGCYRALLVWAASQDLARRAHETPDELCRRLSLARPAARQPLEVLTALFVEHQYSARPVDVDDADQARAALSAVRAVESGGPALLGEPLNRPV
jgi:hypothetical protein